MLCVYSVSQKVVPPQKKTFCSIFTQVKYISVKFCQYVASLYLHIFTNFARYILIFNKIALIFLGVPVVFNVFSLSFKSNRRNFITNNEWSPIHPTSIHWIIRLGGILESYYKLQRKLTRSSAIAERPRCSLFKLW